MTIEYYDKFEYKYESLHSKLNVTINKLNELGKEGWELIELIKPKSTGDQYKAILKRKMYSKNI